MVGETKADQGGEPMDTRVAEKAKVKELRSFFYEAIGALPKRRYRKLAGQLIQAARDLEALADAVTDERAEKKREREEAV